MSTVSNTRSSSSASSSSSSSSSSPSSAWPSSVSHHFADLRTGVRLHYVKSGPAIPKDGKVLLFVHGWPDTSFGWRYQLPVLGSCGWLCIAFDCRGYGDSELIDSRKYENVHDVKHYTWKQVNEDMTALLIHEGIEKCIIVCHDWGGVAGWTYARRYPWRVSAIAALLTSYRPRKKNYVSPQAMFQIMPQFYYQYYFSEFPDVAARELEQDIPRTLSCIFRSSQRNDHPGKWMTEQAHKAGGGFLSLFPATVPLSPILNSSSLSEYVRAFTKSGFRNCLNYYGATKLNFDDEYESAQDENAPDGAKYRPAVQVECPALMVTAGQDKILKPQLTMGMESWVPKLQRAHIENAAHWIAMEQPDQLNEILIKFTASLPAIKENVEKFKAKENDTKKSKL